LIKEIHKRFLEAGRLSTDTRRIEAGDIFVALRGEHFDGNKFINQALEAGARYVICDDSSLKLTDERILRVKDSLSTLQELAAYHRKYWGGRVLAITGSNGKTTTKELVYKVLAEKYSVLSTRGNLNNHIGVPLTLLELKNEDIAVIEMGANHQGEIGLLSKIADPDIGLITNIGKAHLEGFGGLKGVRIGKGELYDYLASKERTVLLNVDDKTLVEMCSERSLPSFGYGLSSKAEVRGKMHADKVIVEGEIILEKKGYPFKSSIYGSYNFLNILAAAAAGSYLEVPADDIIRAIESYQPDNNRSERMQGKSNAVIRDAYNANPSSMREAISEFARLEAGRKLLILGDMLELGEESEMEHEAIIRLLQDKGFRDVILVGEIFFRLSSTAPSPFRFYPDIGDCITYLQEKKPVGFVVLLKGSRKIALEKATKWLHEC